MGKLRYAYSEISEHYDDKFWWRDRFLHRIVGPFHTGVYPTRENATNVTEADWDTLVILDACRSDLFEGTVDLGRFDTYERITSRGSATKEWVNQNFMGGEFGDTVYVTANPYVSRETSDCFHKIYEPWIDDFDIEEKTVLPGAVTEAAIEAHEAHPDKRVIVHYMQPHHPFIGSEGLQDHGWRIEEFDDWNDKRAETGLDAENSRPHTPWDGLYMGLIDREHVWGAYQHNLELAMEAVWKLVDAVSGKIVVSSDHGNMLGERTWPVPMRVYGHPSGVRNQELVEVPWGTVQKGDRRDATVGTISSSETGDTDEIEERLKHLGYR